MKYLLIIATLATFTACSSMKHITRTQVTDFTEIKKMVNEKNFDFVAERMIPAKGMPSTITDFYNLKVSNDSLYVQLPYRGQAYLTPIDPSQSPLDFTSTSFDYTFTESKDRMNVTIKPKDKQNVQQFMLEIFSNGSATLNINSSDRQGISYNGYIAANP